LEVKHRLEKSISKFQNFSERFKYAIIDAFGLDEEDVKDQLNSDVKDVLDYSKF